MIAAIVLSPFCCDFLFVIHIIICCFLFNKCALLPLDVYTRQGKNVAKVTTLPATISRFTATPINEKKKRRTAAYARVSTDSEEQLTSYSAQVDYYTNYIKSRDDWEFVSVLSLIHIWSDSKSQKGAYKILSNAKKCADANQGYSVFDASGNLVYAPASSTSETSDVPFTVQVSISDLNIRKGPGADYAQTGKFTGKGVFTIVEDVYKRQGL